MTGAVLGGLLWLVLIMPQGGGLGPLLACVLLGVLLGPKG